MDKPLKLDIVEWEGKIRCVYLNDCRIAGLKPWGGGTIIRSFNVSRNDLKNSLADTKDNPHG